MLKKIKEMLYNKKTIKEIENVEFENFSCLGNHSCPVFYMKSQNSNFQKPFIPETERIFVLAIEKLKVEYFKRINIEDFKLRVNTYCKFFNFDETVANACLDIYKEKVENLTFKL